MTQLSNHIRTLRAGSWKERRGRASARAFLSPPPSDLERQVYSDMAHNSARSCHWWSWHLRRILQAMAWVFLPRLRLKCLNLRSSKPLPGLCNTLVTMPVKLKPPSPTIARDRLSQWGSESCMNHNDKPLASSAVTWGTSISVRSRNPCWSTINREDTPEPPRVSAMGFPSLNQSWELDWTSPRHHILIKWSQTRRVVLRQVGDDELERGCEITSISDGCFPSRRSGRSQRH